MNSPLRPAFRSVFCRPALGLALAVSSFTYDAQSQTNPAAPAAKSAPATNPAPAAKAVAAKPEPTAPKATAAPKPAPGEPAKASAAAAEPASPGAVAVEATSEAAPDTAEPEATSPTRAVQTVDKKPEVQKVPEPKAPAKPEAPLSWLLRVYLSVGSVWNKDQGYDYFSKDDVGQRIGLLADIDVLDLSSAMTLALEAGIMGESSTDGEPPSGLVDSADLSSTHLLGGIVGRYALFEVLDLHARIAGGASFSELTVDTGGENIADAESVTPFVGVGGGFSVMTLPRRLDPQRKSFNSITFGARLEGGYVMAPELDLAFEDRAVDLPDQRLRVEGASLGSLDRSGAYLDVAAFVRF